MSGEQIQSADGLAKNDYANCMKSIRMGGITFNVRANSIFFVWPTKRQWCNVFLAYIKSFPNVYYLRWSVSSHLISSGVCWFYLSLQGLFWALACNYMMYDNIKLPHIKGEPFTGNSSYVPIYTNYMPTEFLINGIVSGLLTVVNVMCIFITAIIVLKIKEVAAPYTSSPDLRR